MTKTFLCLYQPGCNKTFRSKQGMEGHCKRAHGGFNTLHCKLCKPLRTYANAQSYANHKSIHKRNPVCSYCEKVFSPFSVYAHEKICKSRTGDPEDTTSMASDDHEAGQDAEDIDIPPPRVPTPLYVPPKTGLTRDAHNAPSDAETKAKMNAFYEWVENPAASGKSRAIPSPKSFLAKFRTVMGKLRVHHKITVQQLYYRLNRTDTCKNMFKPSSLNKFTSSLRTSKNKRKLCATTLYNYIRTLTVFLEWKVSGLGKTQFQEPLKSLLHTQANLNEEKKWEHDPKAKADRLSVLPSVPDFLDFLKGDLRDKAVQARIKFPSARPEEVMDLYLDLRNYILFALLFGVPPQRLQVFDLAKIDEVEYKDKHTVISVKKHKTASKYGAAVIVLPPFFYEEFKAFAEARSELARVKFDDGRLFIGENGKPEKYLTKQFQAVVFDKFKVNVNIRDCRSIYVTHAVKSLDLTQLYELSRQMCHSFETQQIIYRSDNNIQRAIDQLDKSGALTALMPLCNLDCVINKEASDEDSDKDELDDNAFDVYTYDLANEEETKTDGDFYGGISDEALLHAVEMHNSQHDNKI